MTITPPRPRCSHVTRRGRPCRNPATPGSDPPACAFHRRLAAGGEYAAVQPYLPGLAPPPDDDPDSSVHLYLTRPAAEDLRSLAASAMGQDLQPEIDLTRVVLRRLMAFLDESAGTLSPEEARRIAGLLFSGARTVAMLQGKRGSLPAADNDWLTEALRQMGDQYGREL